MQTDYLVASVDVPGEVGDVLLQLWLATVAESGVLRTDTAQCVSPSCLVQLHSFNALCSRSFACACRHCPLHVLLVWCRRLAATREPEYEPKTARLGAAVDDDELAATAAARRSDRWQPSVVKQLLWKVLNRSRHNRYQDKRALLSQALQRWCSHGRS